jgi:hypothetical protein
MRPLTVFTSLACREDCGFRQSPKHHPTNVMAGLPSPPSRAVRASPEPAVGHPSQVRPDGRSLGGVCCPVPHCTTVKTVHHRQDSPMQCRLEGNTVMFITGTNGSEVSATHWWHLAAPSASCWRRDWEILPPSHLQKVSSHPVNPVAIPSSCSSCPVLAPPPFSSLTARLRGRVRHTRGLTW